MKPTHKQAAAIAMLFLAALSCKTLQTGDLPVVSAPPTAKASAPSTEAPPTPTPSPTLMAPISSNQPFKLTGTFKSTSEIGGKFTDTILFTERQVILFDMHGFITRDENWELPVESQVLGQVQYNPEDASGTYTLLLPQVPQGSLNDVDNNGQQNVGVQVFAVDYEPNITGDPFLGGDDRLRGWPGSMASIKTTPDDDHEVTGGKLLVYAPTDQEGFPGDFGPDGKLFSADDPVVQLPAGYSIVDLDMRPFAISQPAIADLPLYEAPDAGPKDYSNETYTQAFDHLVEFLRENYAFSGIPGKEPDWDQLVSDLRPRVQQAENDRDVRAYYAALRDFTYAFKDGHVGINSQEFSGEDFSANYSGSLGFTVRVLDNQDVMVNSVLQGGPAEKAGIKTGALINEFDGKPVLDVIQSQPLFFGNQSSDIGSLYYKAVVLTRTKPNGQAEISFTNPGEKKKSVKLRAIQEVDSLLTALGYDQGTELLPVELDLIPVGGAPAPSAESTTLGYIRLNTNIDDLNLILRLFERGLIKFQEQNVSGIIIDLRDNSGGVPLGMAGFLTDQDILLGQLEYFDSSEGKFMARGEPDKVIANQNQYRFAKIAVLVGLKCASACELEAYAFGKVPGAVVVGQYPSSGIEAEVSKGQIKMPEGIGMQFPTGRMINPDGSLFLEGVGVQPTIKVPITAETILTDEDVVLQAAIQALTK